MGNLGWNYETLRLLNLLILFVAWCFMLYRMVLKLMVNRKAFSWARACCLAWTTLAIFAIGEILYDDNVPGGLRVIGSLFVALLQLYTAIFKMDFYDLEPGDEYLRP